MAAQKRLTRKTVALPARGERGSKHAVPPLSPSERSITSLSPFLRGEGWGEGPLSHRDSWRLPLTRAGACHRAALRADPLGATSPRTREEVKNLRDTGAR